MLFRSDFVFGRTNFPSSMLPSLSHQGSSSGHLCQEVPRDFSSSSTPCLLPSRLIRPVQPFLPSFVLPRTKSFPVPKHCQARLSPATMTPPSSPLGAPDTLPPTLWSPEDPCVPILHSIGFTVDGWTFPDGLPTWAQVRSYKQQHLQGNTFNPLDELDRICE